MEDDNFECVICESHACSEVYSQEVVHPLWWKGGGYEAIDLRYVICNECGFVTQFPSLQKEVIAEYYKYSKTPTKESFADRASLFEDRKAFISNDIDNMPQDRVIEVGAAYGDFLSLLTEFRRRIAIEPSTTYGEALSKLQPEIELIPNLLEEMDVFEIEVRESADLVVSAHVLEHTSNPYDFVGMLISMVKEDGYLMLEVPSLEEFSHCKKPIFQNFFFGHLHHFSLDTLNRLCLTHSLTHIKSARTRSQNYPVIRVLYQKKSIAEKNLVRFTKCMDIMKGEYEAAIHQLFSVIAGSSSRVLVWGCGDDLIRLIGYLSDSQLSDFKCSVTLCDRSAHKQGQKIFEMEITSPDELSKGEVSDVVVAVKSHILSSTIVADAEVLFPNATVRDLF